jgi:2-polyprenyl-3-methyl-5-hydroxy-6-metoxy-1,4-benzoquinol methylase
MSAEEPSIAVAGKRCMLCGSTARRPVIEVDGFELAKCVECGLVYVANPPDAERLKSLYSFSSGYHQALADPASEVTQSHRRQGREYLEWLASVGADRGRLLDVGCSVGVFMAEARDHGFTVRGVEFSADTADVARSLYGLDVQTGTIDDLTSDGVEPFDIVTMWDVIEHLEDPLGALRIVHRLLRPGGVVAIRTPNIDGLFPRRSYRIGRAIRHWPHAEPPAHLVQFSKATLSATLERAGFRVSAITDERIPLSYTFGSVREVLSSPKRLAYAALFAPVALAGPWLHAGDEVFVAARKPEPGARALGAE